MPAPVSIELSGLGSPMRPCTDQRCKNILTAFQQYGLGVPTQEVADAIWLLPAAPGYSGNLADDMWCLARAFEAAQGQAVDCSTAFGTSNAGNCTICRTRGVALQAAVAAASAGAVISQGSGSPGGGDSGGSPSPDAGRRAPPTVNSSTNYLVAGGIGLALIAGAVFFSRLSNK